MTRPTLWTEGFRSRLPELMRAAIADAKRADQPFGCALAHYATGDFLGSAPNSDASDPTGHAEVNALRLMSSLRLNSQEVVLVSTAEPCPMCAAACYWGDVRGVVFGTSIADLIRFGWGQIDISAAQVLRRGKPERSLFLEGGFLADETDPLYRNGPHAPKKL